VHRRRRGVGERERELVAVAALLVELGEVDDRYVVSGGVVAAAGSSR
jgi:hypothetical protein